MKRFAVSMLAGIAAIASFVPQTSAKVAVDKTKNVEALKRFKYTGGTELDHDGRRYLYAGEMDGRDNRGQDRNKGGVHIYDTRKEVPKEVGFIKCPGNDNDVAVVKPGLLALGYATNQCNPFGSGITLFDVDNPKKPKQLGSVLVPSAHTITVYPNKPIIYVSPGGLANGAGTTQIVDVSNVRKPEVVSTFKPNPTGCHDLSFSFVGERKLAFCAGAGEIQIWDVRDPLRPTIVTHIVNPLIQFPHYALASPDGNILVIDDEAFAVHECITGQSPSGALFVYDISIPEAPIPIGRFAPPRGNPGPGTYVGWTGSWCTSHHYNFVPGTRDLVISWFTGGTSVLDLSNPPLIEETAYYRPADTIAYTSHFFDGRVFVNDMNRGLEVLEVKGLKAKKK